MKLRILFTISFLITMLLVTSGGAAPVEDGCFNGWLDSPTSTTVESIPVNMMPTQVVHAAIVAAGASPTSQPFSTVAVDVFCQRSDFLVDKASYHRILRDVNHEDAEYIDRVLVDDPTSGRKAFLWIFRDFTTGNIFIVKQIPTLGSVATIITDEVSVDAVNDDSDTDTTVSKNSDGTTVYIIIRDLSLGGTLTLEYDVATEVIDTTASTLTMNGGEVQVDTDYDDGTPGDESDNEVRIASDKLGDINVLVTAIPKGVAHTTISEFDIDVGVTDFTVAVYKGATSDDTAVLSIDSGLLRGTNIDHSGAPAVTIAETYTNAGLTSLVPISPGFSCFGDGTTIAMVENTGTGTRYAVVVNTLLIMTGLYAFPAGVDAIIEQCGDTVGIVELTFNDGVDGGVVRGTFPAFPAPFVGYRETITGSGIGLASIDTSTMATFVCDTVLGYCTFGGLKFAGFLPIAGGGGGATLGSVALIGSGQPDTTILASLPIDPIEGVIQGGFAGDNLPEGGTSGMHFELAEDPTVPEFGTIALMVAVVGGLAGILIVKRKRE